MFTHSEAKTP